MIYCMLGLWNDGYRKIIFINNHGHLWMLESAIHEFCKRYQLPGIFRVIEWHRAVREFFYPTNRKNSLETNFIHADEAETAVALLMFKDMIDMSAVQDADGKGLLPDGHMDKSVDPYRQDLADGPKGKVMQQSNELLLRKVLLAGLHRLLLKKQKRPIAAILKYLTLLHDEILEAFPAGTVPPVDQITLRKPEDMEPFLREPLSEGWKSVDELPRIGIFERL